MRIGLLGSLAALAASASLAFGQPARVPSNPAPPPGAMAQVPPGFELMPGPGLGDPNYAPGGPGGPSAAGALGLNRPDNCSFLERYWTTFEYLLWVGRDGPSNWPIAVSGTVLNGANPQTPGSVSLLGGQEIEWDAQNGARFVLGGWLPGSTRVGLEATATVLETKTLNRSWASGPQGIPVLGTPFVNELTGTIDSVLASSPGNPGSIFASAKTQMFAIDLNMLGNVLRTQYMTVNLVGGFRFFSLSEGMYVQHNGLINTVGFTFQGVPIAAGTRTALEDRFDTTNRFYGGQIGFQFEYRWRQLAFDFGNEFAMGVMRRAEDLSGFSQAGAVRVPGGVLVQNTNIGRRVDNEFGVVPQLDFKLGWQASPNLRLFMGLDFMYASSVLRPGNQVDPVVNPTLVPFRPEFGTAAGTARPGQLFVTSDWWVTGVSWGMNLKF
jgi:Putative beta barrel porin-7 (BBP7)